MSGACGGVTFRRCQGSRLLGSAAQVDSLTVFARRWYACGS